MIRMTGEALAVKPAAGMPKFPDKKEYATIIRLPAAVAPKKIAYIRRLIRDKKCTDATARTDVLTRTEEVMVFKIYETIVARAAFFFEHYEPDPDSYRQIMEGDRKSNGRYYREMFKRLREIVAPMNGAKFRRVEVKKEVEKLDRYRKLVEELVCGANIGLVCDVAKIQGVETDSDRIQEGLIGICRAIETFDYRRGNRFATYATHQVRAHIRRERIDKGRSIRVPANIHEDLIKLRRIEHVIYGSEGREATDEEIAEITGFPMERVKTFPKVLNVKLVMVLER